MNKDIIVIGGGVVGCAVARLLSRYQANIAVLEGGSDVADGASKANSGIVHAGFDAKPGTLKAKLNVQGAKMYEKLCAEVDAPYGQPGAMVLAFSEEERAHVEMLCEQGRQNGVEGVRIIERDEILALEPNVNPDVVCALLAPTSGLTSPYELTCALADHAAVNGVTFLLETFVNDIRPEAGGYVLSTNKGDMHARIVVNCAGVNSAKLHNLLSNKKLTIIPRKGEYYLLDHTKPLNFTMTMFQTPTKMGKGILVSPTVHGNLLLGPTALDIEDGTDVSTTAEALKMVSDAARKTWPRENLRTVITTFAGIRAHEVNGDFVIGAVEGAPGAYETVGIESPGLTSAPAIAEMLVKQIAEENGLAEKAEWLPAPRREKPFYAMTLEERAEVVKRNPEYGALVCRCEQVTEAEIRAAIRRPVGARTIDAVKRRTRAGMGRCQGGFCSPRVLEILSEELNLDPTRITKCGGESRLLVGTIAEAARKGMPDMLSQELRSQVQYIDVLIIGAGPAGMAAAIAAREAGVENLLVLEREQNMGGILRQCIHNGFGLHRFKEELTGPEYAQRDIDKVRELGIEVRCGTTVLSVDENRFVTAVSREKGVQLFEAGAVILAMGCRERPRGALATPGTRCAGVYSAGTAQKFVNLEGYMPGKRVVILGSGDIGLIMARRMTLQGAKVLACVELMPYSSGLNRNIVQCLQDYDIPLYLSHTVVDIEGRERLSGVTVAQVDGNRQPIPGTEKHFDCDTLLLSVGLIPENELTEQAGVTMSPLTQGAVVDDSLQTDKEGIFACGNVLHVHDLVDFVSAESFKAGAAAAAYVQGKKRDGAYIALKDGNGVRGVVPQRLLKPDGEAQSVQIMFRPSAVFENATLRVMDGDREVLKQRKRILTPGEMAELTLKPEQIKALSGGDVTVCIEK